MRAHGGRRAEGRRSPTCQSGATPHATRCRAGSPWPLLRSHLPTPPVPRPQVWHPGKYAAMLAAALSQHGTQAWLVNTGWTGGGFGVGARHDPRHTRAVVDAILTGTLLGVEHAALPGLGLAAPCSVPGVPAALLDARGAWRSGEAYDEALRQLATLFNLVSIWVLGWFFGGEGCPCAALERRRGSNEHPKCPWPIF